MAAGGPGIPTQPALPAQSGQQAGGRESVGLSHSCDLGVVGKQGSEVSLFLNASRIVNLKRGKEKKGKGFPMDDLSCAECICMVVSANIFNSLMEKEFMFLIVKGNRAEKTATSIS